MPYSELPADSELSINATSGGGSIEALQAVGIERLRGKTVLEIANPLDFSKRFSSATLTASPKRCNGLSRSRTSSNHSTR